MGHIVRNAWSRRCSHSFHGHSYLVEFVFESKQTDNGGMVCDFGFIKKYVYPFVDSFDHASMLWDKPEDKPIIELFKDKFERVVVAPFTSTAEYQAAMFFKFGSLALQCIEFVNGEKDVELNSVRVHETTTGWAEHCKTDRCLVKKGDLQQMYISQGIVDEWPVGYKDFYTKLLQ